MDIMGSVYGTPNGNWYFKFHAEEKRLRTPGIKPINVIYLMSNIFTTEKCSNQKCRCGCTCVLSSSMRRKKMKILFFANEQKTFEIEFVTFLPLFFLRFQQIIQFYDFLYFYNTFIFKRLSALSCCVAWGQVYKLYRNATEVFKEKLQRKERNLLLHPQIKFENP